MVLAGDFRLLVGPIEEYVILFGKIPFAHKSNPESTELGAEPPELLKSTFST